MNTGLWNMGSGFAAMRRPGMTKFSMEPAMNDTDLPNPAEPALAPEPAPSGRFDALVERWWNDHFPGSPVAQSTTAWNHAFAAKEALKQRLNEEN
jgi:hypothetical protein